MLTDENFQYYATRNYINKQCITQDEFNEDLARVIHIKRLMNRMIAGEEVSARLILNHIIVIYNVFKPTAATAMLFLKIEKDKWVLLNTFLVFLKWSPTFIDDLNLSLEDMEVDQRIMQELKGSK